MVIRYSLVFALLISAYSFGQNSNNIDEQLDVDALFKKGKYSLVVKRLEFQARSRSETRLYLESLFKLQDFEKFNSMVISYLQEKEDPEIRFSWAQAFYSQQNFPKAKENFQLTKNIGFQKTQCAYYLGYIEYMQGNFKEAKGHFAEVAKTPNDPLQASGYYFFAESSWELLGEKKPISQTKQLIKYYEKVVELDPESNFATQSKSKIAEIEQQLYPQRTKKKFSLRYSQDIKYDTNLIAEAEGKLEKVSYKHAYGTNSNFRTRYTLIPLNVWEATPNVAVDYTRHLFTRHPDIRAYDNASYALNFNNRIFTSDTGTISPDYSFKYATKDHRKRNHQDLYTKSHSLTLTYADTFLPIGKTSVNVHSMLEENTNNLLNTFNYGTRFDQSVTLTKKIQWSPSLSWDQNRARGKTYSNRKFGVFNTFGLDLTDKFDLNLRANYSFTRYYRVRISRGDEHNYNLSTGYSWKIMPFLTNVGDISYTKNISPIKETYRYEKWVYKLSLAVSI